MALSLEPFFFFSLYVIPPSTSLLRKKRPSHLSRPMGSCRATTSLLYIYNSLVSFISFLFYKYIFSSSSSLSLSLGFFFQSGCFQLRSLKLRPQIRNESLVSLFYIFLFRRKKKRGVEKFISLRNSYKKVARSPPPSKIPPVFFLFFLSNIKRGKS